MARLYTSEDGLPSSHINHICQTGRGFIIISTEHGLARFDGMDFRTFRNAAEEPRELSSNQVTVTFEDSRGTMWVGTAMGLDTFDYDREAFTKVDIPDPALHVCDIREIHPRGGSPRIWVATSRHGIYVLDPETKKADTRMRETLLREVPTAFISRMFEDDRGRVWLASGEQGIHAVDGTDGHALTLKWSDPYTAAAIGADLHVTDFAQDGGSGQMIISTSNHGLLVLDPETLTIRRSKDPAARNCKAMALLRNRLESKAGETEYLVGTEDMGIMVYDLGSDTLHPHSFSNCPYDISNWKIHSLAEDGQGNVWVGAFQTGVLVIPQSMYGFRYTYFGPEGMSHRSAVCISSIVRNPYDKCLWVGMDGGGVARLSPDGKKEYFRDSNYSRLSNNSILSLCPDKWGNMWAATLLGGLFIKTPGYAWRPFPDQGRIGTMKTTSLCYDSARDIMYVGTHGNGLSIVSPTSLRVLATISEDIDKWVSTLYLDGGGMLWVGTFNGPMCYNHSLGKILRYDIGGDGSHSKVQSFLEDGEGRMWIGTSEGLLCYDRVGEKTVRYTERDGLPSNVVASMEQSLDGDIWISTSCGLSRLHPDTGKFTSFYSYDGLQDNEFRYGASFRDSDGMLYFGGINGLTSFYPQVVDSGKHDVPDLYFTQLYVMNEKVDYDPDGNSRVLDRPITRATTITLPYSDNTFSLGFAVLEYTNPRRIRYAYRLDRFDEEWRYTDNRSRTATYTNVPPGRHVLSVRAFFEGNEDEYSSNSIVVDVRPPLYASPWAFLLYGLILAGTVAGLALLRRRHLQHLREKEESEIKEMKLEMFTNISHEIRTPLTLVMSPLRKMREAETDPKKKDLYNLMYRNTLRINRLVDQLMDMRRIDDGQLQLHFLETDIVYFIRDIMQSFGELARSRGIDFTLESDNEVQNLWIDQGNFDKVLYNILSNAFKHVPDSGKVRIRVGGPVKNAGILGSDIASLVRIDIMNSGSNIDGKYLAQVFERFFQVDVMDARTGSGVGLNLSKMLVELHHGRIEVHNVEDGVEFSIYIPAGCSHLGEREMGAPSPHGDLYSRAMDGPEAVEAVPAPIPPPQAPDLDRKSKALHNITIVDDDPEILSYLRMELQGEYNVSTFTSAREAWPHIFTTLPDAVITDLIMADMDGVELTQKIKQNVATNHIPVTVLTSQNDEASMQRCLDSGANRFLTKPISIELLRSSISNVISTTRIILHKAADDKGYDYSSMQVTSAHGEFLTRVREAIRRNIDKPEFSVEDLSREVGMSRVHMNRKLKEALNTSPGSLIKTTRLKQAAYLLIKNKVNISEVAYMVGFSTHSYFSSSFKEFFGMSPKEFVAKYRDCTDEEVLSKLFK